MGDIDDPDTYIEETHMWSCCDECKTTWDSGPGGPLRFFVHERQPEKDYVLCIICFHKKFPYVDRY